jgi:hypothetical protein
VDNVPPRADFVANPFNVRCQRTIQALARFCNPGGGRPDNAAYTAWAASTFSGPAPCLLRDLQEMAPIPNYSHVTHSWQSSIGIAQQFGSTTALQVDYVQTNSRNEKSIQDNVNVTFNPATGVPYPYSDVAHRAYPQFGVVGAIPHIGRSDYYGLQSSLTKRLSNRWQANITYTLGWLYEEDPSPLSGLQQYTGPVPIDMGNERSLAFTDQRHRAVFNGIYDVGHGFQVSGIYFYGSGQRDQIVCGCDARGLQISSIDRLRGPGDSQGPVGSIIPRESFLGESDPPRRAAPPAARSACGEGKPHGKLRGVQPLQPEELPGLRPDGDERHVPAAAAKRESLVRPADGAAWIPSDVLTRPAANRQLPISRTSWRLEARR